MKQRKACRQLIIFANYELYTYIYLNSALYCLVFQQAVLSRSQILNSNRTLQDLRKRILTSRKALDSFVLTYKQQIEKVSDLQTKKIGSEDLVKRFENNNEEYLKIKQTVKQEVSSILSNAKPLLRLALDSIIESIRNEPVKYSSLFYYYNNMTVLIPIWLPTASPELMVL
jgi:hypothetical protein